MVMHIIGQRGKMEWEVKPEFFHGILFFLILEYSHFASAFTKINGSIA